jgi:sulfur carrier protein ThiS
MTGMENGNIRIEIVFVGFPRVYDILQGDRVTYTFSGRYVSDLVLDMVRRYGKDIEESLLAKGSQKLDPTVRIMINRKHLKREDLGHEILRDGDEITLLRLLAGG